MSGKKRVYNRKVTFDWMIPAEERHKVELLLASLGYNVDGGGTDFTSRTAQIYIRMTKGGGNANTETA